MNLNGTRAPVQGCSTGSVCWERCFQLQYRAVKVDVLMEPEEGFLRSNFLLSYFPFFLLSYSSVSCFVCYWLYLVTSSPTMCIVCCVWELLPCLQSQQHAVVSRLSGPGERWTQKSVAQTFTIALDFSLFVTYVHEVTPKLSWKLQSLWLVLLPCPDFTFLEHQAVAP